MCVLGDNCQFRSTGNADRLPPVTPPLARISLCSEEQGTGLRYITVGLACHCSFTYRFKIGDVAVTNIIQELISGGDFHQGRRPISRHRFECSDHIFEVGFLRWFSGFRHPRFALDPLQLHHPERVRVCPVLWRLWWLLHHLIPLTEGARLGVGRWRGRLEEFLHSGIGHWSTQHLPHPRRQPQPILQHGY